MSSPLKLKIDIRDHFAIHFNSSLSHQSPGFASRLGELKMVSDQLTNPDGFRSRELFSNALRHRPLLVAAFKIIKGKLRRSGSMKPRHQLLGELFFNFHWMLLALLHLGAHGLNLPEVFVTEQLIVTPH